MNTDPRNTEGLIDRLNYIVRQAEKLAETVVGKQLAIDTATVFTHSREEWEDLVPLFKAMGPLSPITHGKTLYIGPTDLNIEGYSIKYLGLREPDETRPEVGYADYPVSNFAELKKTGCK